MYIIIITIMIILWWWLLLLLLLFLYMFIIIYLCRNNVYIYIHIYIYTYIQTYNMYDIYIYTVYTVYIYIYIQWDIPQLDWDHHFQAHPSSVEALVPLADVFNHRCQKVPKGEAVREVSGGKRWRPWRDERMDHGIPK